MLLDKIIDHIRDVNAIEKEDVFTVTANGKKRSNMTTASWQLFIQRKYGSTDWFALKDIKKPYLVELTDYEKRMNIDDEPVFSWWFSYIQRKIDII